jgi:hypothetical protein
VIPGYDYRREQCRYEQEQNNARRHLKRPCLIVLPCSVEIPAKRRSLKGPKALLPEARSQVWDRTRILMLWDLGVD